MLKNAKKHCAFLCSSAFNTQIWVWTDEYHKMMFCLCISDMDSTVVVFQTYTRDWNPESSCSQRWRQVNSNQIKVSISPDRKSITSLWKRLHNTHPQNALEHSQRVIQHSTVDFHQICAVIFPTYLNTSLQLFHDSSATLMPSPSALSRQTSRHQSRQEQDFHRRGIRLCGGGADAGTSRWLPGG